MTSYKTTTIVILAAALASGACQRQQANYCPDVHDHNCMELDALPDTAPPIDAPPDANTNCYDNTNCSNMTPICGIDYKCRICTTNIECDTDACLPDGTCAKGSEVAYVSQNGQGTSCTAKAPCGTLQKGLDKGLRCVRVSGSLSPDSPDSPTTINRGVIILGDIGSELKFTNNQGSALKINLINDNNDPTIKDPTIKNDQVVINNFKIIETGGDANNRVDSIQILGMNPIVELTHVSIEGGTGNGISSEDSMNNAAMNPNIILTDVIIRLKGLSGIHTMGGQLTIAKSSIFSNSVFSPDPRNITAGKVTAGIDTTGNIKGFIDETLISDNTHGNGIAIQGGRFTINRSSILNNGNFGISCSNITSGDVMISNDTIIIGNTDPQTNGCKQ